ncbi:hypothetical protein ACIKP7_03485 [Pseudomonas caricapapayae]|uniref:Uncharacterized protein n=1 Tax=Pseudomonas caricapapayae TaxID=46678 RepID=A0ACC7LRM2_9PSED
MASNLEVNLQLGTSVTFTVGIAFKAVEDRIKKNTKVLENIFAEVFRLRNEAKPVPSTGVNGDGELRPYLNATLNLLQQQLVALRQQRPVVVSVSQAGAAAKAVTPERDNLKVFEDLPALGQAVKVGKALVLPTQISAQYQKITRDIAISAGVADGDEPSAKEQEVIGTVSAINEATGMERNQAATLIKQLYDSGMGLDQALAYAPVAAKFSVGQDASTDDTARLIGELRNNPKIKKPADLEKALEHIVLQRKGTGEGVADSLTASQSQGLTTALNSTQPLASSGILDRDLIARRGTSDRRLSEASDAVDDSLRSLGDSIRPLSDGLAEGVTATAKAFTGAPDAIKWLIAGATVLGTTFMLFKGGTVVQNLLNKVRERLPGASRPETLSGGSESGSDLSNMFAFSDPLNVFVVNASDIGCCVGHKGREQRCSPQSRRKGSQRRTPQSKTPRGRTPQSKVPKNKAPQRKTPSSGPPERLRPLPAPASPAPPTIPSAPVSTVGKIGAAIKEVRGPAFLEAGIKTVATFVNAETPAEKAEGYGAAAGGLVGSVIGGMVGSVVPVIGTSIGALLGGMAGDALGGWLGKRKASSGEEPVAAAKPADNGLPVAAQPGDVVRSLVSAVPTAETPSTLANAGPALSQPQQVSQQFTFTPNMPITVQGSVTDPMLLAQNLQAMVRRELEELMRMATSRQLSDVPHVYV